MLGELEPPTRADPEQCLAVCLSLNDGILPFPDHCIFSTDARFHLRVHLLPNAVVQLASNSSCKITQSVYSCIKNRSKVESKICVMHEIPHIRVEEPL